MNPHAFAAWIEQRAASQRGDKEVGIQLIENGKFGDYRLLERISKGGLATLWLATDPDGRSVALRVMHDTFGSGSNGPVLFRHGCEIMAKLAPHPNVVTFHDNGKESGREFAVLQYVEGMNLREMNVREDPMLEEILSDMIVDLAAGLVHIHGQGIMHLDLKPENLIVSRSGTLYLCDFDTAQLIPDHPMKFERKSGTPLYMAPEVVNGWRYDQRADIYSFGVTVYEMLTQVKPFEGQTSKEKLTNQLNPKYLIRKPRKFNPNIPQTLEELILKCLEFVPEKRYLTMGMMARDLHTVMGVR